VLVSSTAFVAIPFMPFLKGDEAEIEQSPLLQVLRCAQPTSRPRAPPTALCAAFRVYDSAAVHVHRSPAHPAQNRCTCAFWFARTRSTRGRTSAGGQVLVSFAVGGLLADVFLHILPHSIAHAAADARPGGSVDEALAFGLPVRPPPPPPPFRTDWTRLVPPPVLTGQVSSLCVPPPLSNPDSSPRPVEN